MGANAKSLLWFFVIFLAGSSVGFLVGGYTGSNFGMALIVNSALNRNVLEIDNQLQALRQLRANNTGEAIELIEKSVDDTLIVFDPAEPYPGVKDNTLSAINAAIENVYDYRREYPRKSDQPHVDTMVQNLFQKHNLTP